MFVSLYGPLVFRKSLVPGRGFSVSFFRFSLTVSGPGGLLSASGPAFEGLGNSLFKKRLQTVHALSISGSKLSCMLYTTSKNNCSQNPKPISFHLFLPLPLLSSKKDLRPPPEVFSLGGNRPVRRDPHLCGAERCGPTAATAELDVPGPSPELNGSPICTGRKSSGPVPNPPAGESK